MPLVGVDIMGFNEIFKELRKSKKLKQWEMAAILNTDRSTITKWETGKSKPAYDMMVTIADYFNVSTDYLLGISDEREDLPTNKKEPINDDGLSDNKKALIAFAETVPEDKAAMILQVMKSIVEAD